MEIRFARHDELYEASAFVIDSWRWAYKDIFDAAYLTGLSHKAWHESMIENYGAGKRPLLLFDQGELLGYCAFKKSNEDAYPDDGMITAIYLREDAVGNGYGHALLTRAEEELFARGYQSLVLYILSQNELAIVFYRAHGFVKVGEREHKWGDREYPLDIMRKAAT